MSHTAGVERKKIRLHDSALAVDAIRGVGWYARCGCGWIDLHPFRTRDEAMRHAQQHRETQRGCGL